MHSLALSEELVDEASLLVDTALTSLLCRVFRLTTRSLVTFSSTFAAAIRSRKAIVVILLKL
jgi:hypothetical protein